MLALAQSSPVEVNSPDRQIAVHFSVQTGKQATGPDGQLVYAVTFHGKQVFEDSALRLEFENQTPLGASVHISTSTTGSGVDDYSLLAGKTSAVHDPYNSLTLQVRESAGSGRTFEIETRAYNSGLAFRYHVPEQPGSLTVSANAGGYRVSAGNGCRRLGTASAELPERL
jgi:alpha-glucosidase